MLKRIRSLNAWYDSVPEPWRFFVMLVVLGGPIVIAGCTAVPLIIRLTALIPILTTLLIRVIPKFQKA